MGSIQPAVVIGVDTHKSTLAVAGIDTVGAHVFDLEVPNTTDGINDLIRRINGHRVTWAIEGTGGYGRALTDRLIDHDHTVIEVPTRLTARYRTLAGRNKTDSGDAVAVARAAQTEPRTPITRNRTIDALRVLVTQRDALVRTQTRTINRIRARLAELDPDTEQHLGRIRSRKQLLTLTQHPTPHTNDPYQHALHTALITDTTDALTRYDTIRTLTRTIEDLLPEPGHALTAIDGIGTIAAATILAHTGDITRFPTEGHYASYCGTAPLDASSGKHQRHRLNRHGNRTLNRVLHTAIITQHAHHKAAHHYITRKQTQGKTTKEAIRAATRKLTRTIYRTLKQHPLT